LRVGALGLFVRHGGMHQQPAEQVGQRGHIEEAEDIFRQVVNLEDFQQAFQLVGKDGVGAGQQGAQHQHNREGQHQAQNHPPGHAPQLAPRRSGFGHGLAVFAHRSRRTAEEIGGAGQGRAEQLKAAGEPIHQAVVEPVAGAGSQDAEAQRQQRQKDVEEAGQFFQAQQRRGRKGQRQRAQHPARPVNAPPFRVDQIEAAAEDQQRPQGEGQAQRLVPEEQVHGPGQCQGNWQKTQRMFQHKGNASRAGMSSL